jgi:cytochrome c-type biogenesis protein CcmH/NrfF
VSPPTVHDQSIEPFANVTDNPDERKPASMPDLPPVEPPSAGFVVQLFVIPAVVVVVVIVVWLLFGKLAGGERDAMEYVRQLRSPTANWRLAFELANLIQHDPKIGSDPVLLGELSDLLSHELDRNQEDLRLTQYVALTLGAFRTLEAKTQSGQIIDPLVPLALALAPKYPTGVRLAAAASLAKQAARLDGSLEHPGAIKALGDAAAVGEPEVRQMAVYALGFFGGPSATQILRERVSGDEDRFVRYNAAVALARRGDPAGAPTLREMLSTTDLNKVIDLPGTTEKQNKIEAIELEAVDALRNSIAKGKTELAESLRPQITDLTKSGLVSVRSQSQEILQNLQRP